VGNDFISGKDERAAPCIPSRFFIVLQTNRKRYWILQLVASKAPLTSTRLLSTNHGPPPGSKTGQEQSGAVLKNLLHDRY
jgi:hypothetical protein